MPSPKTTSNSRPRSRASRRSAATAMLTTTFSTEAGVAHPKGAKGVTFRAPSDAAQVLVKRPAKMKPLLQGYGEAVAKSREVGRPVRFRVEVDPSGETTVTAVEGLEADTATVLVEEAGEPSAELREALAAAHERGRLRAAEILAGPDMLSADALAEVLGTTRATINTKRQNRQLLGLDGAKRGFRFPVWQIGPEGKPYPELPKLHDRLGEPWAVYRFLVQPQGALGGMTGREALEGGRGRAALEAAESLVSGDFR